MSGDRRWGSLRMYFMLPCLAGRTMVAQQGKCVKEWMGPNGTVCMVRTPGQQLHENALWSFNPSSFILVPQLAEMDLTIEAVRQWHDRLQGVLRLCIDSEVLPPPLVHSTLS